MQNRPVIKTAIPKRRYQIGAFDVALLGEIESGDARSYRYILAFVQTGQAQPSFYVCVEQDAFVGTGRKTYGLRVINEVMSEVVDTGSQWGDLDRFAEQGIKLGLQALGLQQERIVRLM
ncbi:MAG: hypothetical protein LJE70_14105 [Chromatiaceae bacterium]|jgi:hypothetical protein|nr:hypothetical protein [Chromatiaceae bacterium]